MRQLCWVTAICFLGYLVPVNLNYAQETPALSISDYIGTWSGKTSQGFPIALTIEDINGHAVVTKLGYKITLEGMAWGWQKTVNRLIPRSVVAYVINGKFSFEGLFLENPVELMGEFVNASQLTGTLKESNVFPGGIITAAKEVTYTATKE
jgi:hypothetical protein